MRLTFPMSALLVFLAARPSAAQAVFVEGGAFVGIERLSHTTTQPGNPSLVDLSGTTAGGEVSAGTFLSPQWSVRAELAVPNLLKKTTTTQPPIPQPLLSTFPGISQPGVVLPIPISASQLVERDYRAPGVAVLVGYHTARQHSIEVGFLGGFTFLEERQHTFTQTSFTRGGIVISPQVTEATTFTYRAAAAAGLDVDIAVASHLSLVPQIRAAVFTGSVSVRPAAALRWIF
jgi:hypothetical protein